MRCQCNAMPWTGGLTTGDAEEKQSRPSGTGSVPKSARPQPQPDLVPLLLSCFFSCPGPRPDLVVFVLVVLVLVVVVLDPCTQCEAMRASSCQSMPVHCSPPDAINPPGVLHSTYTNTYAFAAIQLGAVAITSSTGDATASSRTSFVDRLVRSQKHRRRHRQTDASTISSVDSAIHTRAPGAIERSRHESTPATTALYCTIDGDTAETPAFADLLCTTPARLCVIRRV